MRKTINWSVMTLLILCHTVTAQQNVNYMANKTKIDSPYQVRTFEVIDRVVDAAYDGWDAIFEKDKPKVIYNAFNIGIDTTYESRKQHRDDLLLSMKNRDIPKQVDSPAPIFEEQKQMTVKFVNGRLVPINDSTTKVGIKILDRFGIDVDDNLDSIWLASPTFEFNGEVYTKMTKQELEELDTKPIVKKTKKIKLINNNISTFVYSSKGTESAQAFIDEYSDEAETLKEFGIPVAVTLSMAVLESRHGQSYLTKHSNNLFSIKDKNGRCNDSNHRHFRVDDDKSLESFHVYNSFSEAFLAYKDFLKQNSRYKPCFACQDDIGCWLKKLDKSGYATNPNYGRMLLEIINKYRLTDKRVYYPKN